MKKKNGKLQSFPFFFLTPQGAAVETLQNLFDGDSKGPRYFLMSASGTRLAPTNLVNNDFLGGYQFAG